MWEHSCKSTWEHQDELQEDKALSQMQPDGLQVCVVLGQGSVCPILECRKPVGVESLNSGPSWSLSALLSVHCPILCQPRRPSLWYDVQLAGPGHTKLPHMTWSPSRL